MASASPGRKRAIPGASTAAPSASAEREQERERGDAENDVEAPSRGTPRYAERRVSQRGTARARCRELIGGHHEHGGNGDLAVLGWGDEARDDQRSDEAERARAHAGGDRPERAANGLSSEIKRQVLDVTQATEPARRRRPGSTMSCSGRSTGEDRVVVDGNAKFAPVFRANDDDVAGGRVAIGPAGERERLGDREVGTRA